ncbi:MAG: hypothetical protein M3680_12235 [Myxococcota bacterium]|nr:hypothetical protein [Myxococcota bacterium]
MTDLWFATRADRDRPFSLPEPVADLNTSFQEASASLLATGRVIVFTSNRPGSVGALDLWYATRATATDGFTAPQLVPGVNTTGLDYSGFVRPDGCELFFSSNRDGSDDLFVSEITP